MNLVRRESLRLDQLDLGHELLDGGVMLRAGVRLDLVAIGAQDSIDRQVHRLAQSVPAAIVNGRLVGELAQAAQLRFPLRSQRRQIEHALAEQRPLGVFQPALVAPVGVPVTGGQRVVALDPAIGDDAGELSGAAAPGVEVVDADFLDGQVRQVRRLDAGALRGGQPRIGQRRYRGRRCAEKSTARTRLRHSCLPGLTCAPERFQELLFSYIIALPAADGRTRHIRYFTLFFRFATRYYVAKG